MQDKIMQVFYGSDRLPYKDIQRQVHYPNVGSVITGENNTTKIKFYVTQIGGSERQWVANIVTQSGKHYNRLLTNVNEDEEVVATLDISDLYASEVGKINIGLQGYAGNVLIEEVSEGVYEINGEPTILATGNVLIIANYTPNCIREEMVEPTIVQQLLGAMGMKLSKYGNVSIIKYDSLAQAQADIDNIANGQVVLVKVGDYYQYKIKSGGSLVDIATQQASQITIGGIYESFEDLPTPSEETNGKIYLVKATTKTSDNLYNEYITIYDNDSYQWEQAGVNVDDLYPSFSILRSLPKVNINGKSLGNDWTATFTSGDNPYFTIKYDNRNISKESAIGWLKFATGIETLPTFSLDSPKQVYIAFVSTENYGNPVVVYNGDLVITKVQWEQGADEYGQLKLYIVKTIGSRYHDLTILGSGTYGGVTLRSGNGHDIDIVNNETGNKIAIYRASESRLICFDNITPNTDNTISLGIYDSETPTKNRGYKYVVGNNFVLGSKWLIKRDASGNFTLQSLENGQELFKLTSSGYVYTRGLYPVSDKNRPLGGDGAEFQLIWTPILKTKDNGVEYTKNVKDLMTKDETYSKAEVDSLIAGVTGVTHKYQHKIRIIAKNLIGVTEGIVYFNFISSNSQGLNTLLLLRNSQEVIGSHTTSGYIVLENKYYPAIVFNKSGVDDAMTISYIDTEELKTYSIGVNSSVTDNVVQIY